MQIILKNKIVYNQIILSPESFSKVFLERYLQTIEVVTYIGIKK